MFFLLLPLKYFSGHTNKLTILFINVLAWMVANGFWRPSFISFALILQIEVVNGFIDNSSY
jgi:hypothetical protein